MISLNPAVQFFSKVWVVRHQFVHIHDIWLGLGMALYLVCYGSRFGKHKLGSSVGVTQFASLPGIGSPDPFTMMESNYLIWLSITTRWRLADIFNVLRVWSCARRNESLIHSTYSYGHSLAACSGPVSPSIRSRGRVISVP